MINQSHGQNGEFKFKVGELKVYDGESNSRTKNRGLGLGLKVWSGELSRT